MDRTLDLFVPGRVCLFGEHSDWAGAYRRFNSAIREGQVIIAGTNQGVRARVRPRRGSFLITSVLPDGSRKESGELPMDRDVLFKEAQRGDFFSYAAGVACYMLTFYEVGGLEIENHETTLPVQKGLSSSAALCVLVARAFNRIYDLKLTTRAEMEAAYQGEILTPSRCGRMDQGCAFGQVPVLMTFDGDQLRTRRLGVGAHFHMLVADLKGSKDTIRILSDLNRAYPFARDDIGAGVHNYLGEINSGIVARAVDLLETGRVQALGELMGEAQAKFDTCLTPACPQELKAEKLHAVLGDPKVNALVHGGKGVGSQGDGCVQFVTKGEEERRLLAEYLGDAYGMECFPLDIRPPQTVRKAVIPAAGFGTRMFPASKAVKKELFPIITPDGVAKPIILAIVEEAMRSGIDEVAVIVRPEDESTLADFFSALPPPAHYNRLPDHAKKMCRYLQELAGHITFIIQDTQEGFGHAVFCARDWVGDEPFLLLLGDHIYVSTSEESCSRQLVEAFAKDTHKSVVGLYVATGEEVAHYGTVAGAWLDGERRLLAISELAEKPSLDYARSNLVVDGMADNRFLCVYGQYVLTPAVFEHLRRQIDRDVRESGEIQLTTALESLRQDEEMLGCVVDGEHYDTGLPETYLRSMVSYQSGSRE